MKTKTNKEEKTKKNKAATQDKTDRVISKDISVLDDEFGLSVTATIPLAQLKELVSYVAECVFDNGVYQPDIKDFLTNVSILSYYTNIGIPSDLDKAYKLVEDTMTMNHIIHQISPTQLKNIRDSITELIEFKKSEYLVKMKNTINEPITSLFNSINDLMVLVANKIEKLDVSEDSIKAVTKAITDKDVQALFSEKNIISELLKQKKFKGE